MAALWQDPGMTPPVALAISAHDPLGGAGFAADITTFSAFGVHGVQAVTAMSSQHLDRVDEVVPVDPEFVFRQIDAILDEVQPASVKTGLLGSVEVVSGVARRVAVGRLVAPVVDPVLVDGRGNRIVSAEIETAYREVLFPVARVLTPNLAEAALLTGAELRVVDDVIAVADSLAALGAELLVVTGGGFVGNEAVDVAVECDGSTHLLRATRCDTSNVRGSGCTFAAAIASGLARGLQPLDAAHEAKRFVSAQISESADWGFRPGKAGPVSHLCSPFG